MRAGPVRITFKVPSPPAPPRPLTKIGLATVGDFVIGAGCRRYNRRTCCGAQCQCDAWAPVPSRIAKFLGLATM